MTIQVPYRGIIEITGDHNTGKTIAALQTSNNMKDIVFVDDDVKGDGTVRQMKEAGMEFDEYINLGTERLKLGNTPTADELLSEIVLPTIQKIKAKKRKIIVWDTWRIVYQSARGHVERNKSRYNNVVDFTRGTAPMIQGLISKVARMIERKQLMELKEVCDLLIITHHIKDNYVSNVLVGKIPESSANFDEICNMRVWLRKNVGGKVPIVLFLKTPNIPVTKKGKLIFTDIVPPKITPIKGEESIWDAIHRYELEPVDGRELRQDELPNPEELAAISGTLTDEQRLYVRQTIEYNLKVEKELAEAINEDQSEKQIAVSVKTPQDAPGRKETASNDSYPRNGVELIARAKAELGIEATELPKLLHVGDLQDVVSEFIPEHWDALKSSEVPKRKKK